MDRTGPTVNVAALLKARRQAALAAIGEFVLDGSNERVPVDEGELRDSGGYTVVHDRVYVSYRDSKAVAVHEDMESNFDGGRQSKFLEVTLTGSRAEILRVAADKLRLT